MKEQSFILENCPDCLDFFLRVRREYAFLFEEFNARIKHCKAGCYGACDIFLDVSGVVIYFETSPRDGLVDLGCDIILPVEDDPDNKLNRPHYIGTILDFIDNAPPQKYEGPDWVDRRFSTPDEFRRALPRVIEFYKSPQFHEAKWKFNEWLDWYYREFRKSVAEYHKWEKKREE